MNLASLNLQARGPDLLFAVLVQPGARRDEIVGVREGVLKVAVTAPPVDGKANTACRRLLADALKVPINRIEIFAGAQSRRKRIR
ncbi:MAG: DUF167 domain-containing protein, partial [Candidatus Methylomirabilales bacterium]